MEELVGQQLGRYSIERMLGRGGMAAVFLGHDAGMGREVAVKVFPREFARDETFVQRFTEEVKSIARLSHPNIVPVHDFGTDHGWTYIVMAYMAGGPLTGRIRKAGGAMSLDEVVACMDQIGSALDYAHAQGVIHRDFKPDNVLMGDGDYLAVSDFGISKVAEAARHLTGTGVFGTPAYMAPEMSSKRGLSPLVDVYAVGVTLFELLTGRTPFEADTLMGLLMAHMATPVPDARSIRPDLPDGVQLVIEGAMAKDPTERYQSAGAIVAGLREVLGMPAAPVEQYYDGAASVEGDIVTPGDSYLDVPAQTIRAAHDPTPAARPTDSPPPATPPPPPAPMPAQDAYPESETQLPARAVRPLAPDDQPFAQLVDGSGRAYRLPPGATTIGRGSGNDIIITGDPTLSRKHARIDGREGAFYILDLGSGFGTFVNRRRIAGAQPLAPGDVVKIGDNTLLRFELETQQAAGATLVAPSRGAPAGAAHDRRPPPPAARVPPLRKASPEMPGAVNDDVHFTMTCPAEVEPGASFVLMVWAHMGSQRAQVLEQAKMAFPRRDPGSLLVVPKGPLHIARGTILTVRLQISGLRVGPQPEDTILWDGDIGSASFAVHVPKKIQGSRAGSVLIYANGLRIATLNFVIDVFRNAKKQTQPEIEERRIKTAFASYAHEDRDDVLSVIQGLQKGMPQLEVFLDVASLRSGDKWQEKLEQAVTSKDVFYLFWSVAAQKSQWVEAEWKLALRERGLDYIDPVPLVSPEKVPPPGELSGLHFNDWMLAFKRRQR